MSCSTIVLLNASPQALSPFHCLSWKPCWNGTLCWLRHGAERRFKENKGLVSICRGNMTVPSEERRWAHSLLFSNRAETQGPFSVERPGGGMTRFNCKMSALPLELWTANMHFNNSQTFVCLRLATPSFYLLRFICALVRYSGDMRWCVVWDFGGKGEGLTLGDLFFFFFFID